MFGKDVQRRLVWLCFFISGLCGLIYEVVWAKMLGLVFGNTTFAISTILTTFMTGLALGSLLVGRLLDKGVNPLKTYALLELGISGYAVLFAPILRIQEQFHFLYLPDGDFMVSSLLLFFYCLLVLIVPTVMMGGTLPAMVKYMAADFAQRGVTIGRIYAVNTLGAAVGCFAAGYFLILWLGISGTVYAAASLNLTVAAVALALCRQETPQAAVRPEKFIEPAAAKNGIFPQVSTRTHERERPLLLPAFFVSGFTAMVYEVSWTRLFSLILGSSVYAFSTMLTAFLCGIVLGSYLFIAKFAAYPRKLALFGAFEIIIGLYCLLLIPGFNEVTYWSYLIHTKFSGSFALLQFLKFALCFYMIILPTALFGATFPLAASLYLKADRTIGGDVGVVYFANTIGSTLGSFLTGFLLIPLIGIRNSMIIAVVLNLAVGNLLFWFGEARRKWLPLVSVMLLIPAFFLQLDKQLLTSGMFLYAYGQDFRAEAQQDKLLFYREGASAVVSVHLFGEPGHESGKKITYLKVNGKTDASSGADMVTQVLSGTLPMLAAESKGTVAVIGLGSGVTATAAVHFDPEELYVIEIEREMVAASHFFDEVNQGVLNNPKVKLVITDGRHFIQSADKKFDVIISEPSNPWIAGIGSLFSDDFYKVAKGKLNPDGIYAQWVSADRTPVDVFRIMLNTFTVTFPNAMLWACSPGHYLLIGSNNDQKPLPDLAARLPNASQNSRVVADLSGVGIFTAADLRERFVLDGPGLKRLTEGARVNSDNWPLLEYLAPYGMYQQTVEINRREIEKNRWE